MRRVVDHSGLSVSAVADRTGYSKTSWERYLNGRLLPPEGAVVALAEATGADAGHLTTMWELAERAWSRSEMRHDPTMEAIRIAQARAALGEFGPPPAGPAKPARPGRSPKAPKPPKPQRIAKAGTAGTQPADSAAPSPARSPAPAARRLSMVLAGAVGALLVIAAAVLFLGLGRDDRTEAAEARPTPTPSRTPGLPAGVKCSAADCTGEDPEAMGCSGRHVETVSDVVVGGAFIEVRYSKVCGAVWARITQAAPGDKVRIAAAGRTERRATDEDHDAYTRMVAVSSPSGAKACVETTAGASGCTKPGGTGRGGTPSETDGN